MGGQPGLHLRLAISRALPVGHGQRQNAAIRPA